MSFDDRNDGGDSRSGLFTSDVDPIASAKSDRVAWLAFVLAAIFEFGGNAIVRTGIKANNGIVMLFGSCGARRIRLDRKFDRLGFSEIFGVYVGLFALVAVLFGKFYIENKFNLLLGLD